MSAKKSRGRRSLEDYMEPHPLCTICQAEWRPDRLLYVRRGPEAIPLDESLVEALPFSEVRALLRQYRLMCRKCHGWGESIRGRVRSAPRFGRLAMIPQGPPVADAVAPPRGGPPV